MRKQKSVFIVNEQPIFRAGLKSFISQAPQFAVSGEAETAAMAIRQVEALYPDIIIQDISLSDKNGIALARNIRTLSPRSEVLIIGGYDKISHFPEMLRAGAMGYIVRTATCEMLLSAMQAVSKRKYYLDGHLSDSDAAALMDQPIHNACKNNNLLAGLTPREQEIIRSLAEGFKPAGIAKRLFISQKTVENHKANIMRKLNLHNQLELIRYAVKICLIDVDTWKL